MPAFSDGAERPAASEKPNSKSLWFWILLAFLALAVLGALMLRPRGNPVRSGANDPLVGSKLTTFELAPLTGDPPALALADLSGQVTLVNFWGTWCPPCRVEFPHLDALRKELADNADFRFVSVSCWQGIETDIDLLRSETETFLKEQKSDLATYRDPDAKTRIAIMDALKGRNLVFPMTFLFDRQGVIRGAWLGYWTGMEKDVQQVTQRVLAEK